MSLPILTPEQLEELVLESAGRAFSWQDSPEWFCGTRKCTFAARDGVTPSHSKEFGTMQSLAYSCRDKCMDYQRAAETVKYADSQIDLYMREYARTRSKRRQASIAREVYLLEQDRKNARNKMDELRARYFAGYEGRFLIS